MLQPIATTSPVVTGVLTGTATPMGPFATAALALRWFVSEPLSHPLRSGWLGADLVVHTVGGLRIGIPLAGLRLRHAAGREFGPLYLEPNVPSWLEDVERPIHRWFFRERTVWTEVALKPNDRVQVVGGTLAPTGDAYRTAADGLDATLSPRGAPIELSFL